MWIGITMRSNMTNTSKVLFHLVNLYCDGAGLGEHSQVLWLLCRFRASQKRDGFSRALWNQQWEVHTEQTAAKQWHSTKMHSMKLTNVFFASMDTQSSPSKLSIATKIHAKAFEDALYFTNEYTQIANSVIYLDSSWIVYFVERLTSDGSIQIMWWAKQNAVGGNTFQFSYGDEMFCSNPR